RRFLAFARTTNQRPALRRGPAVRPKEQGRRVDRLPARPRTPGTAEVHRPGRLEPPRLDERTGPPGWPTVGRSRWCPGLRPRRLGQEGQRIGWRGPAVVRPAWQGRELPGRRLPRLRLAQGTRPGRFPPVLAQGVDW